MEQLSFSGARHYREPGMVDSTRRTGTRNDGFGAHPDVLRAGLTRNGSPVRLIQRVPECPNVVYERTLAGYLKQRWGRQHLPICICRNRENILVQ